MADPVTPVLGTLAAIASLLKVARTALNCIKDFRNALAFVSDLLVYIEGYTITMQAVQWALSNPEITHKISRKIPPEQTNLIIGKARDTLDKLRVTLDSVVRNSGFDVSRSKWVQVESKCREFHRQLTFHRESLNAICSAAQSSVLLDDHRTSLHLAGDVILHFRTPGILEYSAQAIVEMDDHAQLVLSQASTSGSPPSLEPLQASDSSSLNDSWPAPTSEDVQADGDYGNIIKKPDKTSPSEPGCDPNCRCVCHTSQKLLPDDLLTPKGQPSCLVARFMRVCTSRRCWKKKRRSKETLIFSSEVLNRALGLKLISKGFNRRFFLKSYPEVSENSDQVRYAASGNLQGLIMLVETGRATVNDKCLDGWSLLHVCTMHLSSRYDTYVDRPPLIGAILMLSCG
jgi:hypothetical protein